MKLKSLLPLVVALAFLKNIPVHAASSAAAEKYCASKKKTVELYQMPWDDKRITLPLPPNFPAPPRGAVLCGTSPKQNMVYYYMESPDIKTVTQYYIPALRTAGFPTADAIGSADIVRFSNRKDRNERGYKGGAINFHREARDLSVMYQEVR